MELLWSAGLLGAGVGAVLGITGAGGGFVIVPALRRFSNVPLHGIVATSLLVIALIAVGTVAGAWLHGLHPDAQGWWFVGGTAAGMAAGRVAATRLRPADDGRGRRPAAQGMAIISGRPGARAIS